MTKLMKLLKLRGVHSILIILINIIIFLGEVFFEFHGMFSVYLLFFSFYILPPLGAILAFTGLIKDKPKIFAIIGLVMSILLFSLAGIFFFASLFI